MSRVQGNRFGTFSGTIFFCNVLVQKLTLQKSNICFSNTCRSLTKKRSNKWSTNSQNICKKYNISGPNRLSKCPESREMDFGHCWGKYVFDLFLGPTTTTLRCDDATNLRLPGPSPITPGDRIPREGPPHLDNGTSIS